MKILFKVLGFGWIITGFVIAFLPDIMLPIMEALMPVDIRYTPIIVGYIGTLLVYFIFPGLVLVGIGSMIKKDVSEAKLVKKEK